MGAPLRLYFCKQIKIIFKHCIKLDHISFCLAINVLLHVKVILKFFAMLIFFTQYSGQHIFIKKLSRDTYGTPYSRNIRLTS